MCQLIVKSCTLVYALSLSDSYSYVKNTNTFIREVQFYNIYEAGMFLLQLGVILAQRENTDKQAQIGHKADFSKTHT